MSGPSQEPMTSSTARNSTTLTNVQAGEKGREGTGRSYLRLGLWLSAVLASSAAGSETPQPAEDAAGGDPTPQTVVTDTVPGADDQPVGSYHQPEWTARRRFPTTRVYVIPAGTVAAEYW